MLAWVRNFFPIYALAKIGSAGRVSLLMGTGFLRINRALGRKNGIWEETKQRRVKRVFPLPPLSVFLVTSFAFLNSN